jgi:hypothetical protein
MARTDPSPACPWCGRPTLTVPNPVAHLTGMPWLRHCTGVATETTSAACTWERQERGR